MKTPHERSDAEARTAKAASKFGGKWRYRQHPSETLEQFLQRLTVGWTGTDQLRYARQLEEMAEVARTLAHRQLQVLIAINPQLN